jgi:hypothetical protein
MQTIQYNGVTYPITQDFLLAVAELDGRLVDNDGEFAVEFPTHDESELFEWMLEDGAIDLSWGDDDGQPSEMDEWLDFDPDC